MVVGMITLEDCVAFCGLTETEVLAIAEHEHMPEIAASQGGAVEQKWLIACLGISRGSSPSGSSTAMRGAYMEVLCTDKTACESTTSEV